MSKYIVLLFLVLSSSVFAQKNGLRIKGVVYDEINKEPVEFASIRLLNAKDSSYVSGTATNIEGHFSLSVKPSQYIVQISFLGYSDKYINVNNSETAKLGDIFIAENSILLNEAVVEAKAIEMQVKGDTLEYNADSYKVQETAVVEDLLKKMPGVEIDDDGKITVNGKEVKKILIDGKEFFTDDPKVASKNLPAKMVNKLQVVDKKSEMAELSGFDDDDEETVINLTIKKGMKQGVFGNAYGGGGSTIGKGDDKGRYEANAMVNYMRDNKQISALGGSNNTNNAGFSDFASGMNGGGPPRGVNFGGNNGITKAHNGGFNIAIDESEKFKWNGDVQYGESINKVITRNNTQYTSGDQRQSIYDKWGKNEGKNFRTNFRLDWSPDSLTRVIFRPNMQYGRNINNQYGTEDLIMPDNLLEGYNSETRNLSSGKDLRFNGVLHLSRKLSDKGRNLTMSFFGGNNDGDSHGDSWDQKVYSDPAKVDSILDQQFTQDDKSYNFRANLSYVEPIGRNNFLQLSYNIRNNNSETDKKTYNLDNITQDYTDIDSQYSRYVKNDFLNQNVTLSFKSVRKKFNYTLGVGLEPSSSKTEIRRPGEEIVKAPRKNFLSFAPNGTFNYLWDKRHNLQVRYRGRTSQPSTLQLFDGITSNEGSSVTRGNPDLRPSFTNNVHVRYQNFNAKRGSVFMIFGRFNHTMNDIVRISEWTSSYVRNNTYKNINGNMDGNMRIIFNTPLRNKKFSVNSMTFGSYTRSNTFIDETKNRANMYVVQENIGLQFRSDKFDFNVRGNIRYNDTRNSNGKNNQSAYNYGGFGSVTWYLPFNFTLDSDVKYSANSGYSNGFKQNEWLWNASLSKQLFTHNGGAGTIRVKIYDIMKEQSNISRRSSADYIEDIVTNSLNSYFMVHLVYKFQIFKGGAKMGDMQQNSGGRRGGRGHSI